MSRMWRQRTRLLYLDLLNLSTKWTSFRDDDGPNLKQKPSELGEGQTRLYFSLLPTVWRPFRSFGWQEMMTILRQSYKITMWPVALLVWIVFPEIQSFVHSIDLGNPLQESNSNLSHFFTTAHLKQRWSVQKRAVTTHAHDKVDFII